MLVLFIPIGIGLFLDPSSYDGNVAVGWLHGKEHNQPYLPLQ